MNYDFQLLRSPFLELKRNMQTSEKDFLWLRINRTSYNRKTSKTKLKNPELRTLICSFVSDRVRFNLMLLSNKMLYFFPVMLQFIYTGSCPSATQISMEPIRMELILWVQLQPQSFTGSSRTLWGRTNHSLMFTFKSDSRLKGIHTFAVDSLPSME